MSDKALNISQWKEFKLSELFEIVPTKKISYKKLDLPNAPDDFFNLPAVTCTTYNNGISCYVPRSGATVLKNMLSIAANGDAPAFYHLNEFTILQDAYALKFKSKELNSNEYLFLLVLLQKVLLKFNWSNKSGWQKVKQEKISLPIDNQGNLHWEFMESTIKQTQSKLAKLIQSYKILSGGGGFLLAFLVSRILKIILTCKNILSRRLLCK